MRIVIDYVSKEEFPFSCKNKLCNIYDRANIGDITAIGANIDFIDLNKDIDLFIVNELGEQQLDE